MKTRKKNLRKVWLNPSELAAEVQKLRRGDHVVITWRSGCRVANDPDVCPEFYITPEETQGTVYSLFPDPTYPNLLYLIVSLGGNALRPDRYETIPVPTITEFQVLAGRTYSIRKTAE